MIVPPTKLVPRMVTLLLLFFAGLDLGIQPHGPVSSSPFSGDLAARDLSSAVADTAASGLIQHVEPTFTKPWEYGMGGKMAYAAGMAPSSPPTALPTSFNDEMVCSHGNEGTQECVAKNDDKQPNKQNKKGKKKSKIVLELMEDKFDSGRTRPKGVISHDDEFNDGGAAEGTLDRAPNIDLLFQIDLDALLANADLPSPLEYAARFAIGFHRTWVYYLWTLPTTLVKSLVSLPKNLMNGWIANPPWILGIVLLIRLVIKILMGNNKSFSLNEDKDDSGGGGGGKGLDLMAKGMDMAKNYATSKFPKVTVFFSTLMRVMKVDMYVVLCGFLIGLVMPSIKEDCLAWISGVIGDLIGGGESGTGSTTVLGDGEL